MSELDKNTFTRGEFSRSSNSAFSVRSNGDGVWRATPATTMPLSARRPEVKVEPKKQIELEPEFEEPKKESHRKAFGRSLGLLLVGAQVITSVLFMISLITMNILTGRWVALVGGILAILCILSAIKLLFQKHASVAAKIACGLISVVAIVGSVFALRYTDAFNGFLNKVTDRKPETKQYSVVVMEKSGIEKLDGLAEKHVGFLRTDEKVGNAQKYLLEKVNFESDFYDDADTLEKVLTGDVVDSIVLETDRMEILREEAEESVKTMRVIYNFEIEVDTENAEISEKQVTKEPFILYISGSDSRNGLKARTRSDVNILAVVNPAKGKILLVSIPRDTYVQLHGTTGIKDKLTHAGVYGFNMSRDTIEDFLGVNIDYTAKVSFDTVIKVVDELNGIEIESDQELDLKAWDTPHPDKMCHFTIGKQKVDGDCALRFARERKSYKSGDRHRGENQMQVISAIVAKLSGSKDYMLGLPEILNIAADSFETSFTRDDISSFIRMQLNDGKSWGVESISVDGSGSMQGTYSMGANRPLYVMIPNQDSVNSTAAKIKEYLSV